MGRISRKKWKYSDVGYLNKGGITDLFDNAIKVKLRINDEELDNF